MILDPTKTYLEWQGTSFPNSSSAQFKAPAGSTIDWGDGTVDIFETASTEVNTHTYTDGKATHTIIISGLTSIDNSAFKRCNGLTSITIGNRVTSIGESAFQSCKSLKSVNIQDGVTHIYNTAFNSCELLTSIIIPNSVTDIGWYAFEYCYNLKSVTLSDRMIRIKGYSFKDCHRLTSIVIPEGVEIIDDSAFGNCYRLNTVVLFSITPPTLASNAIPETISTIYVPQSAKETYKTDTGRGWAAFADKIEDNNTYLSLIRFNKKNKEYIDEKIFEATEALLARIIALENK